MLTYAWRGALLTSYRLIALGAVAAVVILLKGEYGLLPRLLFFIVLFAISGAAGGIAFGWQDGDSSARGARRYRQWILSGQAAALTFVLLAMATWSVPSGLDAGRSPVLPSLEAFVELLGGALVAGGLAGWLLARTEAARSA